MLNMNKYLRDAKDFKWVPKSWGYEKILVNDKESNLCLKKMFLAEKKFCSIHYHRVKLEHFYIESGEMELEFVRPDEWIHESFDKSFDDLRWAYHNYSLGSAGNPSPHTIILPANTAFFIPAYMLHRFTGIQDTFFWEVSTYSDDADSYRLFPSC